MRSAAMRAYVCAVNIHIGKQALLRRHFQAVHEGFSHEALAHELAFDMQTFSVAFPNQRHNFFDCRSFKVSG